MLVVLFAAVVVFVASTVMLVFCGLTGTLARHPKPRKLSMKANNDNVGKNIAVLRVGARVVQFLLTDPIHRSWRLFGHTVGDENINVIAAQPHPVASILTSRTAPDKPTPARTPIPFNIAK